MTTFVANRTWVNAACEKLLNPDCQKRILFFSGESGIGKSTLLKLFLKNLPLNTPCVFVDFQSNAFGIAEIFYRSGLSLGWSQLPTFTERVLTFAKIQQIRLEPISHAEASDTSKFEQEHLRKLRHILSKRFSREGLYRLCFDLKVDFDNLPYQSKDGKAVGLVEYLDRRNRVLDLVNYLKTERPDISLEAISERISVRGIANPDFLFVIQNVLRAKNPIDQEVFPKTLTEAWSQDLQAFDSPIFVLLDSYEKASLEARAWINGPFLENVARVAQLRVLLVGQEVPNDHNLWWGHCCISRELEEICETSHWLSVIRAMNLQIPVPEPIAWLDGVCTALKGHPESIRKVIEGLPTG